MVHWCWGGLSLPVANVEATIIQILGCCDLRNCFDIFTSLLNLLPKSLPATCLMFISPTHQPTSSGVHVSLKQLFYGTVGPLEARSSSVQLHATNCLYYFATNPFSFSVLYTVQMNTSSKWFHNSR